MDGYINVLFVREETPTGKMIQALGGEASNGKRWSHVGIISGTDLYEAVPLKVTISACHRYSHNRELYPEMEIVPVWVPCRSKAIKAAMNLVDTPYGVIDCIDGGCAEILGIQLPDDGTETVNCCKLAAIVIRAGGTDPDPQTQNNCFTPTSLYEALKFKTK